MSNRTVIYARVSTEDQLEKYGLPTQLRACRELASKNGLTVIAEVTDDGVSGAILDRPGLERVRRMARERSVDVVLIFDVDRLSRNLAHLLVIKSELEKTVRLSFVASRFEDSPSGRMLFGIHGVFAEYERETIRARTMRGKKERARSGLIVGGRVPYGYLYSGGHLAEDPERAPFARRIYAEYEAGMSIRGIAGGLRESGAPTWGGGKWGKSSVQRILCNETYAGVAHYGTLRREGALLRKRETPDRIALSVPALVSREQWERVQSRLAANMWVGRPTSRYLLRGLLFCSCCSKRMSGETSKGRGAYRCTGRDPLRVAGDLCHNTAPMGPLDAAVWGAIARAFTDTGFLREIFLQNEAELRSVEPGQAEELKKKASKLRRKEESILSLLIDPDMAAEKFRLKSEHRTASEERRQVEQQLANIERSAQPTGREWLDSTVQAVRAFVAAADSKQKQELVRRLLQRAEWNGEEIRMVCFISPELATTSVRCSQFTGLNFQLVTRLVA